MLTGTELDLLKIIAERGGKESIAIVSRIKGVSSEYGRIVLNDIGRKDYVNVSASGICEITPKGWQELERKGWQKEKVQPLGRKCPGCGKLNRIEVAYCAYCWNYLGDLEQQQDQKRGALIKLIGLDNFSVLEEYYEKYRRGEITEEEYAHKKAQIILEQVEELE